MLTVDPEKLAQAERRRKELVISIETMDLQRMHDAMLKGVEFIEFTPGVAYRLAVIGTDPNAHSPELAQGELAPVAAIMGFDPLEAMRHSAVGEIVGLYVGRTMTGPARPHLFHLASGQHAIIADMDVLAWEVARDD